VFDEFEAEWASNTSVLVEVKQTRMADGVTAMDQNSGQAVLHVEVVLAQHAAA
jgi:hypothetical protein